MHLPCMISQAGYLERKLLLLPVSQLLTLRNHLRSGTATSVSAFNNTGLKVLKNISPKEEKLPVTWKLRAHFQELAAGLDLISSVTLHFPAEM